jgi:hypothetical protein
MAECTEVLPSEELSSHLQSPEFDKYKNKHSYAYNPVLPSQHKDVSSGRKIILICKVNS